MALSTTVPADESSRLDIETFQRLHPRAYLERFLAEGVRPDGRKIGGFRDVSVNVGSISTADGSALVRLGNTTIVCGVKAEIAEPELDRPNHGFIVPNVDLPAICSPKFKPGPPGEEAQVLSEAINEALTLSGALPTSSLCIHPSKSAWVLYIDAVCINYDGNAFDATLLAVMSALKNTRLPVAKYDEETEQTTCSRTDRKPLVLQNTPLAVSFGLFDSNQILGDPTAFEEPLLGTSITVILDERSTVLSAAQVGLGIAASQSVLDMCISLAKARRKSLSMVSESHEVEQ